MGLQAHQPSPPPTRTGSRARQGKCSTGQGAPLSKASQARTCLGLEVEEKLPSFRAPLLEFRLQGASPRFLPGPIAPPKEQLPEHLGPASGTCLS